MDTADRRIDSLLVELDSRRKRSTKYTWLALLILASLGTALLAYSLVGVRNRLKQIQYLDDQITEKQRELSEKQTEIAELDRRLQGYSTLVNGNPNILRSAINSIESNPAIAEAVPRIYLYAPDDPQQQTKAQAVKSQ